MQKASAVRELMMPKAACRDTCSKAGTGRSPVQIREAGFYITLMQIIKYKENENNS